MDRDRIVIYRDYGETIQKSLEQSFNIYQIWDMSMSNSGPGWDNTSSMWDGEIPNDFYIGNETEKYFEMLPINQYSKRGYYFQQSVNSVEEVEESGFTKLFKGYSEELQNRIRTGDIILLFYHICMWNKQSRKEIDKFLIKNKIPKEYYINATFDFELYQDNTDISFYAPLCGEDSRTYSHKYDLIKNEIKSYDLPKTKKFICTNRLPRPHRIEIVSRLLRDNLLDDALISMYRTTHESKDIDKKWWEQDYGDLQSSVDKLYEKTPMILGHDGDIDDREWFEMGISQFDFTSYNYSQVYFDLATHSNFGTEYKTGNITFNTNKTIHHVCNKIPMVVLGPYNILKEHRWWGYKTFDGIIDESYDNERDDDIRYEMVYDLVRHLCEGDNAKEFYQNSKSICEYNYRIFTLSTDIYNRYKNKIWKMLYDKINN